MSPCVPLKHFDLEKKEWVGAFQFHTERQASGILWLVESPEMNTEMYSELNFDAVLAT